MPDAHLRPAIEKYIRRKYAADLQGLKKLADQYWADATSDQVTLTTQSFDGGSASGAITCPRSLLLDVVEDLIAELDDTAPAPRPSAAYIRFK
jgi:hypothetical protein